ncbi:MAG: nucleotidyltransferase domain-containing protein [Candidatus Kuenenia sp.]|nr:nucleotidyltransferase domain-containing protein [Candidatus Kuenenia hertensis]
MKTMEIKQREKVVSILSEVLYTEEGVVFAYLYGSFATESIFNDIDIFIYIRNDKNPFTYPVAIKEKLFDAINKSEINTFTIDDFDVRIINDAPYDIVINILCEGKLMVDKNFDLRTDFIENMSNKYRANYFVLDEAYDESR